MLLSTSNSIDLDTQIGDIFYVIRETQHITSASHNSYRDCTTSIIYPDK